MTDITIRCPIQKVAEYAADPDHAPEWYVNIDSAEWRTEKPLSVHSQIAFKARFLGKDLSYVYEIKEFVPGQKLVMKTANGPFPMETTYEWESIDGQTTKMTLRNQGNPIGFSRVMMPLMSVMMKKANKKDLMKIKEILENS
ncbi:SRPBCC family protein [Rossellomorea sp. YZS02]|uniref:SRPBCC family protein n=1 Tax=Rossellomorea sp. YZS02 TaxID=3097358 RepID=UPI002A0F867E|nr:SRPBCC family protein [Rossellomorea sp. YZS02]MDX8342278.1 SRPBCC family protein [Rossellomorea sp. YZS02]